MLVAHCVSRLNGTDTTPKRGRGDILHCVLPRFSFLRLKRKNINNHKTTTLGHQKESALLSPVSKLTEGIRIDLASTQTWVQIVPLQCLEAQEKQALLKFIFLTFHGLQSEGFLTIYVKPPESLF